MRFFNNNTFYFATGVAVGCGACLLYGLCYNKPIKEDGTHDVKEISKIVRV